MVPPGPLATRLDAASLGAAEIARRGTREAAAIFPNSVGAGPSTAGASAQAMYEQQRRSWLRRNRRMFRRIDLAVGLVVVACLVMVVSVPGSGWFVGLLAGFAIAFALIIRRNPPTWIEQWQAGAVGEQRTGRELASLPAGWQVRHDIVRGDRSNIDHLVIGPAGVFVLDTKNINTEVRIEDGTLVAMRPDGVVRYRTRRPAQQAALTAVQLNRALSRTGNGFWVHAVVVVWGDMPQRVVEGGNVTWVRGDALAEWLQALPAEPYERRLARVTERLDDALAHL